MYRGIEDSLIDRKFLNIYGNTFKTRTKMGLFIPNVEINEPDRFARSEVLEIIQSDEHNNSLVIAYSYITLVSNYTVVTTLYGNPFVESIQVVINKEILQISVNAVDSVIEKKGQGVAVRAEAQPEKKSLLLTARANDWAIETLFPSEFSLKELTERLIAEGKLDENLLYHGADDYGPWDESFNSIDWCTEAGASITRIEGPSGEEIRRIATDTNSAGDI